MVEIDKFSFASGLNINISKTTLINTLLNLEGVREKVRLSPWPTLKVALKCVYLGILMGRNITVDDISTEAVGRLEERANACYPAVRNMHHSNRVSAFNIFMFTKLTYIMRFYSIPFREGMPALNARVERCELLKEHQL
jgi:hypothetical protein